MTVKPTLLGAVVLAVVLAFVSGYSFGSKPGSQLAIRVGAEAPTTIKKPPSAVFLPPVFFPAPCRKKLVVNGHVVHPKKGTRPCPTRRNP